MCSIIGVVRTDVRQIQQDSPLTLALRIAVAVVSVAPLAEAWLECGEFLVMESSLNLSKCCRVLGDVMEGIGKGPEEELQALLIKPSHRFIAEMLDKFGWIAGFAEVDAGVGRMGAVSLSALSLAPPSTNDSTFRERNGLEGVADCVDEDAVIGGFDVLD